MVFAINALCFFQMQLMRDIRESIKQDKFPEYIKTFMVRMYPKKDYPTWVIEALQSVNVNLESSNQNKEKT